MIAKLGGGVEFDRFDLEDFSMRDVSVCHVANVVREGRDLKSCGGGHCSMEVWVWRFQIIRFC